MSAEPTHLELMSLPNVPAGSMPTSGVRGSQANVQGEPPPHHGFDQFSSQEIIAGSMERRYFFRKYTHYTTPISNK